MWVVACVGGGAGGRWSVWVVAGAGGVTVVTRVGGGASGWWRVCVVACVCGGVCGWWHKGQQHAGSQCCPFLSLLLSLRLSAASK
jgi:hypothetical protein